jgi:hypothetical protein
MPCGSRHIYNRQGGDPVDDRTKNSNSPPMLSSSSRARTPRLGAKSAGNCTKARPPESRRFIHVQVPPDFEHEGADAGVGIPISLRYDAPTEWVD